MAAHGLDSFDELLRRSVEDPTWFWAAVVDALGIPFERRWEAVVDVSDGVPWARWFTGATTNLCAACLDRWVAACPEATALVWEGEDCDQRSLTYAQLTQEVDAVAALLARRGVGAGDTVGIFLPMVPEVVAAALAVAKLGAIFLPIFSGYGADAVAVRLADAGAKALICADGFLRRGRQVPMAATARAACAAVASIETVVVVPRLGIGTTDEGWAPWPSPSPSSAPGGATVPTAMVDSETPLFIAYTSGTTGAPKGAVHVHGGLTVKIAEEAAFQLDVRGPSGPGADDGDRLFWFADFGWIMGPWEVIGALANGATVCLYEGAPDWPGPDRLWAYLERHRVTVLGLSPTLVRALMVHGPAPVEGHDLSTLRVLGSTGEPWNEEPWRWYFEVVGGRRCPVINISGGTEVGACFLSPHPVQELTPMTLGGPALGMAVDVFGDDGRPVRGAVGELVCTAPWPGMTRGLWKAPDRYLETYWSRWSDVWVHGDWASIQDGRWYLHGRSDDTIKIAGKRLGPAEVESVLVSHPAVVEAAAVGVPDEVKGEALWVYVVLGEGAPAADGRDGLRAELRALVADRLGRSFAPSVVHFAAALPKTRSAKVLRRAIRATAVGADPGDLSSLEDPAAVEAVRSAS